MEYFAEVSLQPGAQCPVLLMAIQTRESHDLAIGGHSSDDILEAMRLHGAHAITLYVNGEDIGCMAGLRSPLADQSGRFFAGRVEDKQSDFGVLVSGAECDGVPAERVENGSCLSEVAGPTRKNAQQEVFDSQFVCLAAYFDLCHDFIGRLLVVHEYVNAHRLEIMQKFVPEVALVRIESHASVEDIKDEYPRLPGQQAKPWET